MQRYLFHFLLIVAILTGGAVQLASAQDVGLKAVTLEAASVYEAPDAAGEPVGEIAPNTIVVLLRTDPSGAWLEIEADAGAGFILAEQAVILTPAPLAPTVMVTSQQAGAPIFDAPSMAAEMVGSASFGATASMLGESGQWTYVTTWDGLAGWSIGSAWETVGDLEPALINLRATDAAGLFAEANINAELAATVEQGQLVYATGETTGSFAEVMTADGTSGWIDSRYLAPLPRAFVSAEIGRQSNPALYAEPDFSADLLASLEGGTTLTFVGRPDEFWLELYSPEFGTAYGMANQFSPVYTTATVAANGALVREGPSAEQFNAIAQVNAGTEVVVVGTNEDGDWLKVLLPFSEIDSPFRGVEGWMAAFLFQNAAGQSSVDLDILSVVE